MTSGSDGHSDRPFDLVLLSGVSLCVLAFCVLATAVGAGGWFAFDRAMLVLFREPGDLSRVVGPEWLIQSAREVTALGGPTVLSLVIAVTLGALIVSGRVERVVFVFVATYGGLIFGVALKHLFMRPRPTVVPHLVDVGEWGFPSGHAVDSAVVYLTLATLIAPLARETRSEVYVGIVTCALIASIGITRVYLGVHFPTDVLAGWAAGGGWAGASLLVLRRIERRRHLDRG